MNLIINGVLTNYLIINPKAKKDCLVLHGWGHTAQLWLPFISCLHSEYRFILLDLPAHGGTQFLKRGASVPQYSEFVFAFIKKLKLKKPVIIGHSFGGQIAAHLALKKPRLASKLILIAPAIIRHRTFRQKLKIFLFSRFNFLRKLLPKPLLKSLLKTVSSTDYYQASPEHQEILKKIVNYRLPRPLSRLQLPTLLIWGENDVDLPVFLAKKIAQSIPDCRLKIIYNAGHNLYLNQPSQLAYLIIPFLNL